MQFTEAMATLPEVVWSYTDRGVMTRQDRVLEEGRIYRRMTECFMPNIRLVPHIGVGSPGEGYRPGGHLGWVLPIDDTHTTMFSLLPCRKDTEGKPVFPPRARHNGKLWKELTAEEHQLMPGDEEAQVGQGPITLHSDEHLGFSDKGILMIRRLLHKQIEAVRNGDDPVGVTCDPTQALIQTSAGNFLMDKV